MEVLCFRSLVESVLNCKVFIRDNELADSTKECQNGNEIVLVESLSV